MVNITIALNYSLLSIWGNNRMEVIQLVESIMLVIQLNHFKLVLLAI